jgi:hypothetical protein
VELPKKLLSFFLLKHLKKSLVDMLLFLNTSNRRTRCCRVKTRIGHVIIQNEEKRRKMKKKKKRKRKRKRRRYFYAPPLANLF